MSDRLVKLLRSAKITGRVLLTGGLSGDAGLRAVLVDLLAADRRLPVDLEFHPDAAHAGAIGAALWGGVRHRRLQGRAA